MAADRSASPLGPDPEDARFVPAELAPHTLESLYAAHGGSRPWIYVTLLLSCVATLTALPWFEVDMTVRAPAVVHAATSPTPALVEAFVPQRHIGLIRLKQMARIEVDAFPLREYGVLEGTVVTIADEAVQTNGSSTFRVLLNPAATS